MDRSRSRSREPSRTVQSSGRGGFGNITAAHGDGQGLADLEEEERAHHAHVPEL